MFDADVFLADRRALGGDLGRRPYKALRNILCRKPHRFLPPQVPQLVVPGDPDAAGLIDEMLADVDAAHGENGLRSLRAAIERPAFRVASLSLADKGRDYTIGAAVESNIDGPLAVFLTVRVTTRAGKHSRSELEGIRCQIFRASNIDAVRHELEALYVEADSRRALIADYPAGAMWFRGGGAEGLPARWQLLIEAMGATYGFRTTVVPAPETNPRDAAVAISRFKPQVVITWDRDGRGAAVDAMLGFPLPDVVHHTVDGEWSAALEQGRVAFAENRGVRPPARDPPDSVAEAVLQAAVHEDVVILEEAIRSAHLSAFTRPLAVREALETIVAAVANGALHANGGLPSALNSSPFRYAAGVSETATNKYRRAYERDFDGRRILLGPHLKLGAGRPEYCLRIYWAVDSVTGKVVIGHIGDHLPDAGT